MWFCHEYESVSLLSVKHSFLLLIGLLITLPLRCAAFDTGIDGLSVNGYGTLGLIYNDSDNILYRNSIEQEGSGHGFDSGTESSLGLQIDYIFNQQLSFTTQFVAIDRAEQSFNNILKSAFLTYHFDNRFEIGLGRLSNEVFISSEYKNVGFARMWTHLPVAFYGQLAGESYDGAQLKYHLRLGDGVLTSSLWAGRSNFPYSSYGEAKKITFEPNVGVGLRWESQDWLLRLLYSQARINDKDDPAVAFDDALIQASKFGWPEAASIAGFSVNDTWLRYVTAGVSYDKDDWVIQSEFSLVKSETKVYDKYASAYLSVGHRIGNVTPYFIVSKFKTLDSRKTIPPAPAFISAYQQLQSIAQTASDGTYADQSTIGIGARWDVSQMVSLKAQWDRTWIEKHGDFIFEQKNQIDKPHAFNIFSLTVDFIY
jgi:opacity protein-like surface antigen